MTTEKATIERLLEVFDPLPVRAQPMFGEYAVYCDDRIFGFVCDDTLLMKIVPEAAELLAHLPRGEAYPGSKPYAIVGDDAMADRDWLLETAQTIAATQAHKPRKPAKPRA